MGCAPPQTKIVLFSYSFWENLTNLLPPRGLAPIPMGILDLPYTSCFKISEKFTQKKIYPIQVRQVNSKSFISKDFLQIKWKFKLKHHLMKIKGILLISKAYQNSACITHHVILMLHVMSNHVISYIIIPNCHFLFILWRRCKDLSNLGKGSNDIVDIG